MPPSINSCSSEISLCGSRGRPASVRKEPAAFPFAFGLTIALSALILSACVPIAAEGHQLEAAKFSAFVPDTASGRYRAKKHFAEKKRKDVRKTESLTAPLSTLRAHFNKMGFRSLVPNLDLLYAAEAPTDGNAAAEKQQEGESEKRCEGRPAAAGDQCGHAKGGFSGQSSVNLADEEKSKIEPRKRGRFLLSEALYSTAAADVKKSSPPLTPAEREALHAEWSRVRIAETTPNEGEADGEAPQSHADESPQSGPAQQRRDFSPAAALSLEGFDPANVFFDNNRNRNLPAVAVFSDAPALPSTVGECTQCGNGYFISAVLAAEESCEAPLEMLKGAAATASSDFATDMAWSSFCASDCFKKLARIPSSHYCCLGDRAPAFLNLLSSCRASTQPHHSSRYCGAEMSNMLVVSCSHDTQDACQSDKFCEWDDGHAHCLFKATKENLDHICTDCNHRYFTQFPAGGIYNLSVHAALGGVYGSFCNKIDGQYCLMTSAAIGYRMAHNATAEELSDMCKEDPDSIRDRLCHRIIAIRAADSVRRLALESWKTCKESAYNESDCDYDNGAAIMLAYTIERASVLACANDPATGANCMSLVDKIRKAEPCTREVMESLECPASCDVRTANAARSMGCCGSTVGTGGFDIARESPYSSRYIIGTAPHGLAQLNNQSWVPADGERPARTNAEWVTIEERTKRVSTTNSMTGFSNCSSFEKEYRAWDTQSDKCTLSPVKRTYYARLNLYWEKLKSCANKDYVVSALKSDIGAVTGIARAQMTQAFVTEDPGLTMLMEGSKEKVKGTTIALSITGDSTALIHKMDENIERSLVEDRFVFPTAAVEIMMNCPGVLPNSHSPILSDMFAVRVAGEAPVVEFKIEKQKNDANGVSFAASMLALLAGTALLLIC